ncbi:MAG: hypothetical protein FD144_3795 [Rhodospirillaceae bacterium]|nr:MAG: hypothetical protein FD144_3795 [Rhodospirillaceae bacterium]
MAIKNNDDVAHLLSATGRTGTPYREFDSTTDQMSAPLIDAIFGKDPPPSDRDEKPFAVGGLSGNDLLADVFDQSPPMGRPAPDNRAVWRDESFQHSVAAGRSPDPVARGSQRTLADIRRVITQPVGGQASPPSTSSLTGLFDRLAR